MRKPTQRKRQFRVRSSYLDSIYYVETFHNVVEEMAEYVKKFCKTRRVDAIAFTGTSGAAVAYPLSAQLQIPLICIRKSGEANHYGGTYEGVIGIKQYIIVDDCIETGNTIKTIKKEVKKVCRNSKPVAVILYNHGCCARKTCQGIPVRAVQI